MSNKTQADLDHGITNSLLLIDLAKTKGSEYQIFNKIIKQQYFRGYKWLKIAWHWIYANQMAQQIYSQAIS